MVCVISSETIISPAFSGYICSKLNFKRPSLYPHAAASVFNHMYMYNFTVNTSMLLTD